MNSGVDIRKLLSGDRVTVARAISLIENDSPGASDLLRTMFPRTGNAYRVGITGPPGAGKSTITSGLTQHFRSMGRSVGIIAVDPTSPFTGGALLGDRVRMTEVELDPGVFIRSMASRGSLGGLSRKTVEAADILDAAGKDILFLETVGVGQSELDIASAADTTVVVLVPESGDSIQAMKAGLMEIADVFVLNKADRAGADQAVMSIRMILNFRPHGPWQVDILKSVANEGKGIPEIAGKIMEHRSYLERDGGLKMKRESRMQRRIKELVASRLRSEFWTEQRKELLAARIRSVMDLRSTPYDLADELVRHFGVERNARDANHR